MTGRPALALCLTLAALTACPGQARTPPSVAKGTALTEVYVAEFTSDEPERCRPSDVPLNHRQARLFFLRARQVPYKTLQDHYDIAPCRLEGTLKYRGMACDWTIRPGATGEIRCGKNVRYFACDTCDALFETP